MGNLSTATLQKLDPTATLQTQVAALQAQIGTLQALNSAVPANTVAPTLTGSLTVGSTLSITRGVWSGAPTNYLYQWNLTGFPNNDQTYTVVTGDVGLTPQVTEVAVNGNGSSLPATVTAAGAIASGSGTAPAFTADTVPASMTVGTAVSYQLAASGTPTITYSGSGLPPGITVSPAGLVSGTPTAPGTYAATFAATNAVAPASTHAVTITVAAVPPTITTTSLPAATVGVAYTATLAASNSPTSWALTAGTAAGLTLNTSTGVLSGTPTAADADTLTFTASNTAGTSTPATLTLTVNAASTSTALYSVYTYYEGGPAITTLENATGKRFDHVMDFTDGSSGWAGISASAAQILSYWATQPYRMVFGVDMMPSSIYSVNGTGTSAPDAGFQVVASGAQDSVFTSVANSLVANGFHDAVIRLGWEFNLGGNCPGPWRADGNTADFVAAIQHIVTVMRSVSGQNFTFLSFNPSRGDNGFGDPSTCYPGDAYCDWVGLDCYDWEYQTYPGASAEWSNQLSQSYGLNWLASFAAAHSKRIALPEWGINGQTQPPTPGAAFTSTGNEVCGGDNGYFMQQMLAWVASNNALSGMWSSGGCALTAASTPNAIAAIAASSQTSYTAAPVFTAFTPSSGVVGAAYSYTFTASASPAATFTESGTLPAGLSLSSSGVLSGTPTAAASTTFTVTATNTNGNASQSVTMTVGASGTVTAVGSLASTSAAGATTVAVSPTTVGNLLALAVKVTSTTITVSSVTGGGATWTPAGSGYTDTTNNKREEIWLGTVTATGSATVTVNFSASNSGLTTDIAAQEFTAGTGTGTSWTVDKTGSGIVTSTTDTLPSLTPAAAGEIYFGFAYVANTGTAGSTAGYTYTALGSGNWVVYNPSCTTATQAPTFTQAPSGNFSNYAALIAV